MSIFFPETAPSATQSADSLYHIHWERWFTFYNWQNALTALGTLAAILVLGAILIRIFTKQLDQYRLRRATSLALIASAFYFAILSGHPYQMVNIHDVLALIIHKTFIAILLLVAVRFLDRLVILPLLTRISKGPPSRFIHQIVIAVISFFVVAGYSSWAFNFEIGSILAGSAVISIVLGLALQETLGNFFSGMVLQASVPFKAGDWIQIGDTEGRVIEMTWRAVTILTGANNHVLIPNSVVAKEKIVNYHFPSVATAISISVGLDYAIPPNDAKRVLIQAAKDTPGVLAAPGPAAVLASFDDSAILYKVAFWIDQPQKHGGIEEAVRTNVWYRLQQAGFDIPFPMRTVAFSNASRKQAAADQSGIARRLSAIQKSPLFSDLVPELQQKLAAETRDFSLAAGQTFYRQNDPGNSLFVLESGTVSTIIHPDDAAAADIDVGDMTAPAIFGEVSAMTGQPRAATLIAKTDVRAIEVDQNHLQSLFTHDPALMTHCSKVVTDLQTHRDEMLKKLGALNPANPHQAEPATILDRMKRLFTRHGH